MMKKRNSYKKNYDTCELCYAEFVVIGDVFLNSHMDTTLFHTLSERKIDEIISFDCDSTGAERKYSYFLSSKDLVDSRDIRHHINWLLRNIARERKLILQMQNESGLEMFVRCIWWSKYGDGGPVLSNRQIRQLATLRLPCVFQFYASPNSVDEIENTLDTLKNMDI